MSPSRCSRSSTLLRFSSEKRVPSGWVATGGDAGILARSARDEVELGGDYPQSWVQEFGEGRSFYTSLGHRDDIWSNDPVFRAHDKLTGEIIAEIDIPATQSGPPSTYMVNGRQYIVMMVTDGESPAELIALALPRSGTKESTRE